MESFKLGKKYLYWGLTAFLVIIACIAFFWVIQRWDGLRASIRWIMGMLNPFIWGFVIAYLLTPFVKLFQAKAFNPLGKRLFKKNTKRVSNFGRGMSILAALLLLTIIIYAFSSLVIPQVYSSVESIVMNFQTGLDNIQNWAHNWLAHFPGLEETFAGVFDDVGAYLTAWVKTTLLPEMQSIIASVSAGVVVVFKFLANALIAVVVSVYVMFSREKFVAQGKKVLYSVFTQKSVKSIISALQFTNKSFMGFFMGKLLDSLIIGIMCYFGCLLIGIRDAVLISVIIGITNIIPFFGPFIGAIPSALIILMISPIQCLIFLFFILLLQQFDGNILGPKILGNATGINGFWVLFSIIIGAGLFGPIGMIIGVPLFAVIYAGIRSVINGRLKKRGLPWETASYVDKDYFDYIPDFGEECSSEGEGNSAGDTSVQGEAQVSDGKDDN